MAGIIVICPLSEDEADGFPELDEEDEDDEQRGALGNAERGDLEDVRERADMACHHGERHREQDDAKGYDGYQTATEGRGEELARGGKQDGVGHQRQQGNDGHVDDQEDDSHAQGDPFTVGNGP